MFPSDFVAPPAGGDTVVFTFHDTSNSGMYNFAVHVLPEPLGMVMRGYGGADIGAGRYEVALGPIQRGVWYDFVYQVRWSSGPDGYVNAWVNDVQMLAHRGPTLYRGKGATSSFPTSTRRTDRRAR